MEVTAGTDAIRILDREGYSEYNVAGSVPLFAVESFGLFGRRSDMAQEPEIKVRRVRAGDGDRVAAFVNRALVGRVTVDRLAVIERLGSVGLLLAECGGDVLGMVGWQAENLIARVTDLLIGPGCERIDVGRALLGHVERAADELQCEAVLLFMPYPISPEMVEFCRSLGYEPRLVADLPNVWQEAACETHVGDDGTVWMKQLRAKRVLRPL